MTPAISKLADTSLTDVRCKSCGRVLSQDAQAEGYETQGGKWAVVYCSGCTHWTPFRLEAA